MYNPKTFWDEIGRASAPGVGEGATESNDQNKPKVFSALELCKKTGFYLSKIIGPILSRLDFHFLASQAAMVFEKSE